MKNIDLTNTFIIVFIYGTFISFFTDHILEFINYRNRSKNGKKIPPELINIPAASCFNFEKLTKIVLYENANYYVWIFSSILTLILNILLVFTGYYPAIFNKACVITGFPSNFFNTYFCAFLFFAAVSIPGEFLSIPIGLYKEFVIEKKFGFSKMTIKLWILDKLKSAVISVVFLSIILAAMTGILLLFPKLWWILLSGALFLFSLVMQVLYPLVIAPIFNKFTPLSEGELKERISNIMKITGFKANGIFVMDESKRSGHFNAYFSGIGKSKRIVLYDNLINILTVDELEAVLGHELGHYKLKHIIRKFIIMIPVKILLMYILYKFAQSVSLYKGFGFIIKPENIVSIQFIGLFLASIIASPLQNFFSPLINWLSRCDEFAADKFSVNITKNPDALISGLIKLNSENLSELLPSKIYSIWNYDHPVLIERINKIKESLK